MPSRRHLVLSWFFSCLLSCLSLAASPVPGRAADDPAVAHVQAFYDALQKTLSGPQGSDPKARLGELEQTVRQAFDLGAMTRLAVGARWRTIPADKQAKLEEAFGRYFIASYSNSFGRAVGGKFEVTPTSEARTGGKLVHTQVVDASGKGTRVDYLVSPEGKIVDIYFNGTVSEIAAYRTDFQKTLAQGGADALEASLRQRADQMGGAK